MRGYLVPEGGMRCYLVLEGGNEVVEGREKGGTGAQLVQHLLQVTTLHLHQLFFILIIIPPHNILFSTFLKNYFP